MPTHAPGPGHRALRKGRHSIREQTYLITTVCTHRIRCFEDWSCASHVAAILAEPRLWRGSRLQCWVLMPDHLHFMVTLGTNESLSQLVRRIKAVTSRAANHVLGCEGSVVWARGYHDRALRREEDMRVFARYVITNPIRAGIAATCGAYPYWDAVWLCGADDLP